MVSCIYVPPNQDDFYHSSLSQTLYSLYSLPAHSHLIIGDFNMPDIDWSTLSAVSQKSDLFCDTIFNCNLTQLINKPTHKQGNILDLVLTTDPDNTCNLVVHDESTTFSSSDHYTISLSYSISHNLKPTGPTSTIYNFSKANWDSLSDYYCDCDFSICFSTDDINIIWDKFKSVITAGCEKHVPKVKSRRHPLPKWFTPTITHSLNKISTLRRSIKKKPSPEKINTLRRLEEDLNSQINSARIQHEHSLVQNFSSNKSKLYRHLRSLTTSKNIPNLIYLDEVQETDPL